MRNSATYVIWCTEQDRSATSFMMPRNWLKLCDKNCKISDHLLNATVNPPSKCSINSLSEMFDSCLNKFCKLEKRGQVIWKPCPNAAAADEKRQTSITYF